MILEWPVEWSKFVSTQFNLQSVILGTRSVQTPRRTNQLTYQVFRLEGAYKPDRGPSNWQAKGAFFSRLDGQVGRFRMYDTLRCQPTYNRLNRELVGTNFSDGTPWSDGTLWASDDLVAPYLEVGAAASVGSSTLSLARLPANKSMILNAGDLLEIQPEGTASEDCSNLYEIVVGGGSDANGRLSVEIRPRLRINVLVGDLVVTQYARGLFQLTDGDQGNIFREANMGSFSFSAVEYVD